MGCASLRTFGLAVNVLGFILLLPALAASPCYTVRRDLRVQQSVNSLVCTEAQMTGRHRQRCCNTSRAVIPLPCNGAFCHC